MKRLISLILVLATAAMTFTACGSSASSTAASSTAASSKAAVSSIAEAASSKATSSGKTSFSIGVIDPGSSDATSKPLYDSLYQTIEALGGTVVKATMDERSADGALSAVENLISKGVDGLILSNTILIYNMFTTVADLCDENKIYYSFFWTKLEEGSDSYNRCMESPYFISTTYEDDVHSGNWAATLLGKAGCKNICTITLPEGSTTYKMRNEGLETACSQYGMTVLGTCSDTSLTLSSAGGTTIVEDFLSAYPNVDGICILGMSQYVLSGVEQALSDSGRTDIKVSGIDFNEFQQTYIDNGTMLGIIGGHFAGPTYSAILMINAIQGNPLNKTGVVFEDNFIEIDTKETADNYANKIYGNKLYSDKELQNCLVSNNSSFTYNDLLAMAKAYSYKDICSRMGY